MQIANYPVKSKDGNGVGFARPRPPRTRGYPTRRKTR